MLLKDKLQQLGISYSTYYGRLRCGYSKEEALSFPKLTDKEIKRKQIKYNYPDNINTKKLRDSYRWYILKGYTPKKAQEKALNPYIKKIYEGKGIKAWSKELGISHTAMGWRVRHYGWETAVNMPVSKENQKNAKMARVFSF